MPMNLDDLWPYTSHPRARVRNNNNKRQVARCFGVGDIFFMAEFSERPNGGVARRRRERRMPSWSRHEQQSIRMALATVLHHSYDRVHTEYGTPRSQTATTSARGGRGSNETKYTAKIRKTPTFPGVLPAVRRGRRRAGSSARVSHGPCAAGPGAAALSFRSSMLLCRRWGIRCLSCCRRSSRRLLWSLCRLSPCPRSLRTAPSVLRYVVRRWRSSWFKCQPTEPGYALAVFASKFYSRRELRGFLSGQGSTASGSGLIEQNTDIPVLRGRREASGSLQGSRSRQGSAASIVEQNVDIPVPHGVGGPGGPQVFPPWRGFNSVLWSRSRRKSGSSQWRSLRFSPKTGFTCFVRALAQCCG